MKMGKIRWILSILLCLLVGFTAAQAVESQGQGEPSRYVFKLSDKASRGAGAALAAMPDISSIAYADGYYTVEDIDTIKPLMESGLVEYAVEDITLTLFNGGLTNDPGSSQQWYLHPLGMQNAWSSGYNGNGVTVAVIDSGAIRSHEDLLTGQVTGYNFLGGDSRDPYAWDDDDGHGSMITGIIAAGVGNEKGIAGLSSGVNILALRCFSGSDTGLGEGNGSLSVIISALSYAIEQDVDVINLSFGGTSYVGLLPMKSLLDEATSKGIIVVAAVGNDGTAQYQYPAAFDSVIGVGSTNERGAVSSTSQKNNSVFVVAPGENIYGFSSRNSVAYNLGSGTSFSAPMVTAMAAIAKQANSSLDHVAFRELLKMSASDGGAHGYDTSYGHGSINIGTMTNILKHNFAISYELNGGSLSGKYYESTYSIDRNRTIALPAPVRSGYDFTGWYANSSCTGTVLTQVPADSIGNITFYAGWKLKGSVNLNFGDVKTGDWYYDAVTYVVTKGLFEGVSANSFAPDSTMTRAMVVTVLYRLEKAQWAGSTSAFSDVKVSDWYAPMVSWAASRGLIEGSGGTFAPNGSVTRQQLATILYRYENASHSGSGLSSYVDAAEVSDWARPAMGWAVEQGILKGRDGGKLAPNGVATRAEVATIFQRMLG